jgi:hypothetical protein
MSTFLSMIVCTKPEVVGPAVAKAFEAARYDRETSQALVQEPLGDGFTAFVFAVGPEAESRWDMVGTAFELFDEEEGEGLVQKIAASVPGETFYALVYSDMSQFEKAWKLSGARWEAFSMMGDDASHTTSEGAYDSASLIPDLKKFPDEESNLAEQERVRRIYDPVDFLTRETGLSRAKILGAGYDEQATGVLWKRYGTAGPKSEFAGWLKGLGPQVAKTPRPWSALVPEVTADAPASLGGLMSSASLAKTSDRAGDGLSGTANVMARIAIVRGPGVIAEVIPFFGTAMARALEQLLPEPTAAKGLAGLLGVAQYNLTIAACGVKLPEAVGTLERQWLGQLATIAGGLPDHPGIGRIVAFGALAAGVGELVPIALGEGDAAIEAGCKLGPDPVAFARYFAGAMKRGLKAADVEPAFVDLVTWFPSLAAENDLTWFELLCAGRAYFVHFERKPVQHVAQRLHELAVETLARPPAPPAAAVRVVAPPQSAGPRPQREPTLASPPPAKRGLLTRLFGSKSSLPAWYKIELRDVQGMWGGTNIFVFGDGDLWVDQVDRGVISSRLYRSRLAPETLAELTDLLTRNDPRRLEIPMRNGVGGEAAATLSVVTPGWTFSIEKWANDKHAGFDAWTARLRSLAESATGGAPVWQGPFDWNWRPDGR